jgi:hypothetical protein
MKLRKTTGTALTIWMSHIPDENLKLASFRIWKDMWQDNLTPQEAIIKVIE